MPVEPPPTPWAFPPVTGADPDGPVAVGGDLEAGTLLHAYRRGLFPMPVGRRNLIGWFSPDPRAILAPADFHSSRSLQRSARTMEVSVDRRFAEVMAACGDPGRPHGWINDEFIAAYTGLHELGWAHSVEVWSDGELVGGVYGVSIGSFFAGESMFHAVTDASKVALLHLVRILGDGADVLFDVQWLTPHLESLGATEVSRDDYLERLARACSAPPLRWSERI